MVVSRSHWDGDYPHPTLNNSAKGSGGVGYSNQDIFSQRGAYLAPQPVAARMVAFGEYVDDGTASAMKARDYKDATDLVAQPIAFSRIDNGRDALTDQSPTLRVGGNADGVMAVAFDTYNQDLNPHVTHSLRDGNSEGTPALLQAMQVRRLTPVECERLQGFPDNYTNIPWRKKPESPDGPRYKALGNSWAVPNVRWIGKRIQEALNAP